MNKSIYTLVLFLVMSQLCSCSKEPNTYQKIDTFLTNELDFNQLNDYEKIIVVNELGRCMTCNNTFTEKAALIRSSDNYLFLISSPGTKIDISKFKVKQDNILHDPYNKFADLGYVNSCAIIELNEQRVDTVIAVSNENLYELELFKK